MEELDGETGILCEAMKPLLDAGIFLKVDDAFKRQLVSVQHWTMLLLPFTDYNANYPFGLMDSH